MKALYGRKRERKKDQSCVEDSSFGALFFCKFGHGAVEVIWGCLDRNSGVRGRMNKCFKLWRLRCMLGSRIQTETEKIQPQEIKMD